MSDGVISLPFAEQGRTRRQIAIRLLPFLRSQAERPKADRCPGNSRLVSDQILHWNAVTRAFVCVIL